MALNYFLHFCSSFFPVKFSRNKICHIFRFNSSIKDHLVLCNSNSHTADILLTDDFPHLSAIISVLCELDFDFTRVSPQGQCVESFCG